jgi:hypothetical protein
MRKAVKDFFATINREDVNKQLQGTLPSVEVLSLSTIKYELEERGTVRQAVLRNATTTQKSPDSSRRTWRLSDTLSYSNKR